MSLYIMYIQNKNCDNKTISNTKLASNNSKISYYFSFLFFLFLWGRGGGGLVEELTGMKVLHWSILLAESVKDQGIEFMIRKV